MTGPLPWGLWAVMDHAFGCVWDTKGHCYGYYGSLSATAMTPWSTAMGIMGCYVLLQATAMGTKGHYGSLLLVPWSTAISAMGHYAPLYGDYGLL